MCSTKSHLHNIIETVSLKMNFDQMSSSMDPVLGEATGPFNIKDHKCLNDTTICAFRVINVSKIHFISGSVTPLVSIYPIYSTNPNLPGIHLFQTQRYLSSFY